MEELSEESIQIIRRFMQEYIDKVKYLDDLREDVRGTDISIGKIFDVLYWELYERIHNTAWPFNFTIKEERILTVTIDQRGKRITITVPSSNIINTGINVNTMGITITGTDTADNDKPGI